LAADDALDRSRAHGELTVMKRLALSVTIAALVSAGWLFMSRTDKHESPKPAETTTVASAEILNFYARDLVVTEGAKTVLCYGVANATSVRIEPAVEGMGPARSRCVEVRPKRETLYTLTAEGSDGRAVSQSLTLRVAADAGALPKITSFQIAGSEKEYTGRTIFLLTFSDQNGDEISIDPPVFPVIHGAPSGQFYVKPDKTTTYTLFVKSKNGHVAKKQLTVDIPNGSFK
jgi:hypothetical protein